MSEKTPFQLMREQHQSRIQAQKQAANYRAYAYQHGITFTNQSDLHAKMIEIEAEQQRLTLLRQQERERVAEERKQRISQTYTIPPQYDTTTIILSQDAPPSLSITSCDSSPSDSGSCDSGSTSTSCSGSCD